MFRYLHFFFFFFFNDTATTEIYTLSLHDALPICQCRTPFAGDLHGGRRRPPHGAGDRPSARLPGNRRKGDRKSTRLNSSHDQISYAVFCLKKKKKKEKKTYTRTECNIHQLRFTE